MDQRKIEKTAVLLAAAMMIALSVIEADPMQVGIRSGCTLSARLLYPLFHASFLHLALNLWCLLAVVFMYDISLRHLAAAYVIAACYPVDTLTTWGCNQPSPTLGCSAIVFTLFGAISFQVARRAYYQSYMALSLTVGCFIPHTNATIHLYAYLAGLVIALLNKPIQRNGNKPQTL